MRVVATIFRESAACMIPLPGMITSSNDIVCTERYGYSPSGVLAIRGRLSNYLMESSNKLLSCLSMTQCSSDSLSLELLRSTRVLAAFCTTSRSSGVEALGLISCCSNQKTTRAGAKKKRGLRTWTMNLVKIQVPPNKGTPTKRPDVMISQNIVCNKLPGHLNCWPVIAPLKVSVVIRHSFSDYLLANFGIVSRIWKHKPGWNHWIIATSLKIMHTTGHSNHSLLNCTNYFPLKI